MSTTTASPEGSSLSSDPDVTRAVEQNDAGPLRMKRKPTPYWHPQYPIHERYSAIERKDCARLLRQHHADGSVYRTTTHRGQRVYVLNTRMGYESGRVFMTRSAS